MADILHDFPISAAVEKVFRAVSDPGGIDTWWSKECKGRPAEGEVYELFFGDDYRWKAVVSNVEQNKSFELQFTQSDGDWTGTRVGFLVNEKEGSTQVQFYHRGWPEANDHFRISSFCWAMYLRLLKKYLEKGEVVEYEERLNA